MKDNLKTIVKNAGFSFAGQVGGTITRTFYHILIANLLGAASYGLYNIGLSILNILSMISLFGLNMTVVKYISAYEAKGEREKIGGVILFSMSFVGLLSFLLAIVLFVFARKISILFFNNDKLIGILKIFSLALVFHPLLFLISSIFQGFKQLKYSAALKDILQPLSSLIIFVLLFSLNFKLYSAVYAFLFSFAIAVLIGFYILKKKLSIPFLGNNIKCEGIKLLKYSFPILILFFTIRLLNKTDILMLGYFESDEVVGIYAFVYRITYLLFLFWFSFNSIVAPIIASLFEKKEWEEMKVLFKTVTRWIFTLTLPFALFLILRGDVVLSLFKKEYEVGFSVLIIFAVMWIIISFSGSVGNVLIMIGKREKELYFTVPIVILNIFLNLLLIPKLGMDGAALSTVISLVGFNFFKMMYIKEKIGLFPLDKNYIKPLVSTIPLIIFLVLSKSIDFIKQKVVLLSVLLIFSTIVFFITLIILKLPDEDDFILNSIKQRLMMKK